MADNSTIARPYAKAVHDIAVERNSADSWSALLETAAAVAEDSGFAELLASPQVRPSDLVALMVEICGDDIDDLGRNFFAVLAENGRLGCLAAIREEYERLRAESENIVDVELTSAVELTDQQKDEYSRALTKRLGKAVRLNCTTDKTLMGGAIIRAGDMVIDGSLSGRIERMATAVTH